MKQINRSEGFALVEVVVACTILCASCLILVRGFREAVRSVYRSQDYYRAGLILESALWDRDHDQNEGGLSYASGPSSLRNMDMKWEQNTILDGQLDQFQATLSWDSSYDRKESLTLASYAGRIEQ